MINDLAMMGCGTLIPKRVMIIFKGLLEHWHYGVDFHGLASADYFGLLILVTHAKVIYKWNRIIKDE